MNRGPKTAISKHELSKQHIPPCTHTQMDNIRADIIEKVLVVGDDEESLLPRTQITKQEASKNQSSL